MKNDNHSIPGSSSVNTRSAAVKVISGKIRTTGKSICLFLLTLLLAAGACASVSARQVRAASSLTTSVKTLAVGKTYTISDCADVQSSKTNVAVATQKSNGSFKITALKKGRTTLTLYDADGQKVGKVYLLVTNSKSFVYDTSALSLMAGETKKVQATVQNGCTVKYKSSDKSVATVTSSGKIKAVSSGTVTISAKVYYKGTRVKTLKKQVTVTTDVASTTLKTLLQTALEPVGSTMYIWGGGWNEEDTGAGTEARSVGVSPQWKVFFEQQTSSYDYRTTRYQIANGLDCSGYIGWCIYNILNTTDGNEGYVMKASQMASNFASRGWGTYKASSQVSDYKAGDIMSSSGHVWMVIGQCSDGSVVLVHSSPPGVRICGTPSSSGSTSSEAIRLATTYMKTYYPEWYSKYPSCQVSTSYLSGYAQMRWNTSGTSILTDPDGYQSMSAAQILKDLFS